VTKGMNGGTIQIIIGSNRSVIVLLALFFALLARSCIAQEYDDLVKLKNGSVIDGRIIELIPEKSLRIKTGDGKVYFFTMSEVDRISMAGVSSVAVKAELEAKPDTGESAEGRLGVRSRFDLWGGASVPASGYRYPIFDNEIQLALTGFTLGLNYVHRLDGPFGWANQVCFSLNPFDEEAYNRELGRIVLSSGSPSGSGTPWLTLSATTGIEVGGKVSSGVRIYADALFGILSARTPEVEVINMETDPTTQITTAASTSSAIAFGFNVGAIISDRLVLGLRYSDALVQYSLIGSWLNSSDPYHYSTRLGTFQWTIGISF
jgi:hypothetical protein